MCAFAASARAAAPLSASPLPGVDRGLCLRAIAAIRSGEPIHAYAIALGDWHDGPTCPPPALVDRPLRHALPAPQGFGSGTAAGFSACERREAPLPSGLKAEQAWRQR
nr:hypothetical protein BN444_03360 [Xanthomonas translucens pv. translucens DSM 18974]